MQRFESVDSFQTKLTDKEIEKMGLARLSIAKDQQNHDQTKSSRHTFLQNCFESDNNFSSSSFDTNKTNN